MKYVSVKDHKILLNFVLPCLTIFLNKTSLLALKWWTLSIWHKLLIPICYPRLIVELNELSSCFYNPQDNMQAVVINDERSIPICINDHNFVQAKSNLLVRRIQDIVMFITYKNCFVNYLIIWANQWAYKLEGVELSWVRLNIIIL